MVNAVYDVVMEMLQRFSVKPYAMRMTQKQWLELRRDPRSVPRDFYHIAGDPPLFKGVPVRIETRRKAGRGFQPQVFATAEELQEAIYG